MFKDMQTGNVEDIEKGKCNEGHWRDKRTGNCSFIHPPWRVIFLWAVQDSIVSIATCYDLDGSGLKNRCG